MLTPHLIADPEEGRRLTEGFRARLAWLEGEMKQVPVLQLPMPGISR
jgi:hypothetical protein